MAVVLAGFVGVSLLPEKSQPIPDPLPARASRTAPAADEAGRNAFRLEDLNSLKLILQAYAQRQGAFPSTGGRMQTLCVFEALDVGCRLRSIVEELPADPLGKHSGYWYASDGQSFTLVAQWEGSAEMPPGYACPANLPADPNRPRRLCIQGKR